MAERSEAESANQIFGMLIFDAKVRLAIFASLCSAFLSEVRINLSGKSDQIVDQFYYAKIGRA